MKIVVVEVIIGGMNTTVGVACMGIDTVTEDVSSQRLKKSRS